MFIYLCKRRPFPIDYWMAVESTVALMIPLPCSVVSSQCHTGLDKLRRLQQASSTRDSPAAENGILPGGKKVVIFGWQSRDRSRRSVPKRQILWVLVYWVDGASMSGGGRLRGCRGRLKYMNDEPGLLNKWFTAFFVFRPHDLSWSIRLMISKQSPDWSETKLCHFDTMGKKGGRKTLWFSTYDAVYQWAIDLITT